MSAYHEVVSRIGAVNKSLATNSGKVLCDDTWEHQMVIFTWLRLFKGVGKIVKRKFYGECEWGLESFGRTEGVGGRSALS